MMERIDRHLESQDVKPTGPVVWSYDHSGDDRHVWLSAGVPVPPRTKAGKLKLIKVPAWSCLTALYRGSMPGIQEAWQAMVDKAADLGLEGPLQNREIYRKWIGFDSKDNVTVLQLRIK
jgi:effector-binding domain-containing protein